MHSNIAEWRITDLQIGWQKDSHLFQWRFYYMFSHLLNIVSAFIAFKMVWKECYIHCDCHVFCWNKTLNVSICCPNDAYVPFELGKMTLYCAFFFIFFCWLANSCYQMHLKYMCNMTRSENYDPLFVFFLVLVMHFMRPF